MLPLWLSGSRYLQIILANIFNGERSISNLAFDWNLMYFYKTKICSLPETVHWLIAFISVWKSPMEWLVDSWTDYSCQTRKFWKMINSILNRWRWQRICFTFIYCVKRYWEQLTCENKLGFQYKLELFLIILIIICAPVSRISAKCDIWLRRRSIWHRSLWPSHTRVWSLVRGGGCNRPALPIPLFTFSCFRHKRADSCKTSHLPAKLTSRLLPPTNGMFP